MTYDHRFFLNDLINRYENSKLFTGEATRQISIAYRFTPKTIPVYFNESNFSTIDKINESCRYLEENEFITIEWKNEFIIERIVLNIDQLDAIYTYLKRPKKANLESEAIRLLKDYLNHHALLDRFIHDMMERLSEHKSIKAYLDITNKKDMNDVLTGVVHVLHNNAEILKRRFSIEVYKNSKRFEALENQILKIIRDYSLEESNSTDDLLAEYNILSNPSYVYMKGNAIIKCHDEIINLKALQHDIAFSSLAINDIEVIELNARRIITIENLASFYEYENEDDFVIYLGGYHNTPRRKFLQKLYSFNSSNDFYHWGDIDFGGFQIINHLRKRTGIPFKAYLMDLKTLKTYEEFAMSMSKNYQNKLKDLLEKEAFTEFYPTIQYMLEKNIRLEQEIIDVNEG